MTSLDATLQWPRLAALSLVFLILLASLTSSEPARVVGAPAPPIPPRQLQAAAYQALLKQEPVPIVAPAVIPDIPEDKARTINASIPFSDEPNPSAAPFQLRALGEDRERAIDCLAAAMWYEAGADWEGQRAVAQVVINRSRHPAFPKSICGVVFQGSERDTGCQFTFTCDGAMRRVPPDALWRRTRSSAAGMLEGRVFHPVGLATHYHTNWVAPYWNARMEKIAAIRTHLFFRWPGNWGRPVAFQAKPASTESVVPALSRLSLAHRSSIGVAGVADDTLALATGRQSDGLVPLAPATSAFAPRDVRGGRLLLADEEGGTFLVALQPGTQSGTYALAAADLCGARSACRVLGWPSAALVPTSIPQPGAEGGGLGFHFIRRNGQDHVRWDCDRYQRPSPQQCLGAPGWKMQRAS
ncbi:cell wall hydrolase [Sphingomonas sp. LY54]|uniref:cell wall hydrolase n=1 Tax=Sphingomonas sp. LY54 TaxID=3095343 RepID=UPI002D7807B4|nr:cell wall hydrolase [Sphingomonas sp. LY54]WRP28220.1 cell wall hydrolase [Sphingomonas sp. LY54]